METKLAETIHNHCMVMEEQLKILKEIVREADESIRLRAELLDIGDAVIQLDKETEDDV